MRRSFFYFPLDQLAPEGGELALAEAATPTPGLFAEGAAQRLENFGVRPDDLLALTEGREVLAVVHLTALPTSGAPSWRTSPLAHKVTASAISAGYLGTPDERAAIKLAGFRLLQLTSFTRSAIEAAAPETRL